MSTIFYRTLPEAYGDSVSSRTISEKPTQDDSDTTTNIEVQNQELDLHRGDYTKYLFGWSNLSLDLNGGSKRLLHQISGKPRFG
jgi:hypothetical protein